MADTSSTEVKKMEEDPDIPDNDSGETTLHMRPRKPSKFRADMDVALIACVRARPVLYDPDHSRYMDIHLKNSIWSKIGKQLRINPRACRTRWGNLRDNYRKSLRRLSRGPSHKYRLAEHMAFMDRYYKGPLLAANDSDSNDEREAMEVPVLPVLPVDIKVSHSDNEEQESVDEFDRSSVDVSGNLVPMSGPSEAHAQVVDAFLAAIATSLKGLNPYHLSKAKAEIFATVHKYEMMGIVDGGWGARDDNPFP